MKSTSLRKFHVNLSRKVRLRTMYASAPSETYFLDGGSWVDPCRKLFDRIVPYEPCQIRLRTLVPKRTQRFSSLPPRGGGLGRGGECVAVRVSRQPQCRDQAQYLRTRIDTCHRKGCAS